MQSLPLYTLFLFSMLLNDDVADIETPDGISSTTFILDKFSGLLLRPSFFSVKFSTSA